MYAMNPAPFGVTAMVPCYNEIESIDSCYAAIRQELDRYSDTEILFIDDGSCDGTLERIKGIAAIDPDVHYISFARNFGLEAAFGAGFKYASKSWTVQLDADLQSPPHEMHRLIDRALAGYDVVFAIRKRRADPWLRRAGSWAHHAIATKILGIEIPVGASVFRVVRSSVGRKIVESRYSTPYFLATAPMIGARYDVVPTDHSPRRNGEGKWKLKSLFAHAVELFVGFSFRPLAFFYTLIGLLAPLFVLCALAALAVPGSGEVIGWISLASGAVVMCLLAVVARYLVRIMRVQTAGWPSYQIREANVPVDPREHLYQHEMEVRTDENRAIGA